MFTGSRNGSIRRFDTRTRARGQILLGETFTKPSNSVTYLNIIKNWQLLVSTIRGAVRFFSVPWRLFAEIQKNKILPTTRRTRSRYSMFVSCEKHDLLWRSSDTSTHTSLALYAPHPRSGMFRSPSRIILIHFFSAAPCYYPISRLFLCCRP